MRRGERLLLYSRIPDFLTGSSAGNDHSPTSHPALQSSTVLSSAYCGATNARTDRGWCASVFDSVERVITEVRKQEHDKRGIRTIEVEKTAAKAASIADFRGRIFALEPGRSASSDRQLLWSIPRSVVDSNDDHCPTKKSSLFSSRADKIDK